MHKSTDATDFRSKVGVKKKKSSGPFQLQSLGGSKHLAECWEAVQMESVYLLSAFALAFWAPVPLDLTGEGSSKRDRQPPVYFAWFPQPQLNNRLCRTSGQGWRHICSCELWGRCYHPYWVPERRRYFQAVRSTCWFLALSGEFSMQSVSLLVTGSSSSLAHQGFLKEN